MPKCPPRAPAVVTAWIVLCAFCNCAGWILSALHQLNAVGYTIAFGIGLAVLVTWRHQIIPERLRPLSLVRARRRFRRLFPLCFLVLATLAILGGVVHAPTNYDALAYRTPRVLHWLADGRWNWIHTDFNRLNTRAMGFEWVSAPLIVFTGTDRWLFGINATAFFLLPGLVFSVFTRLGIRPRVAWHWMWLLPSGYGFLLQAGSLGNDLFGAVFALVAIDFALRAAASRRIHELCLSIIAAGLLTGSKASNIPLLLPCLVAWMSSFNSLRRNPIPVAGAFIVALAISFVPTAISNWRHCGDWTGFVAERGDAESLKGHTPLKFANNVVLLSIQNLVPPVFPFSSAWNRAAQRPLPERWRAELQRFFEPGGAQWKLGELQVEEDSGLGCGLTLLSVAGVVAGLFGRFRSRKSVSSCGPTATASSILPRLVILSSFVALFAFMGKSTLTTAARLATPYYALCLPALLLPRTQGTLLRVLWWRAAALAVFGAGALLTILSPARPLFPANHLFAKVSSASSALWIRAKTVYFVYSRRADGFAPVRKIYPPDLKILGLVASDQPETSLWRPFRQRRVEHVTHSDSLANVQARGIQYVLATREEIEHVFQKTFEQWLADMRGKVESEVRLQLRAAGEPRNWVLIKIEPPESVRRNP